VSHFIVIFDRSRRADAEVERIDDPQQAVTRLFEVESSLRDDRARGRGVVMLVAEDEATIRATHSHYFNSFDELVELAEA
jgi:hypothetical protein